VRICTRYWLTRGATAVKTLAKRGSDGLWLLDGVADLCLHEIGHYLFDVQRANPMPR